MSRSFVSNALCELVAARAKHRCGYCLTAEKIVGMPMEIDHLIPESLGGPNEEENLWLACSLCNDHKSNRIAGRDSVSGEVVRLFDPAPTGLGGTFSLDRGCDEIVGMTPTGRATVLALNLNRASLVLARQAWVSVGWHPPSE